MQEMSFAEKLIGSAKQAEAHSAGRKKLRSNTIEILPAPRYQPRQIKDIRTWTGLMKRNMAVEEIDRALLMRLIDKIVVGQKRQENGVDYQDITIFYNLVGEVE